MKTEGRIELERRKHQRAPASFRITFEVVGSPGKRSGKAGDISEGGILVYAKGSAAAGDKLRVTIHVDEKEPVKAEAAVAWVRPTRELGIDVGYKFAMGLNFRRIIKGDPSFIGEFVEEVLKGR